MIKFILTIINILISLYLGIFVFDIENSYLTALYILLLLIGLYAMEVGLYFLVAILFGIGSLGKDNTKNYNNVVRKVFVTQEKMLLSLYSVHIDLINEDKIPEGPCVIVGNHQSNLDSICIDAALKDKRIVYVAKKELFKIPFFGRVIKRIGYIKLDRGNLRQEVKAIAYGINLINNDKVCVGVFPEGTRNFTKDQIIQPFKDGCFRLATKTNVPIVVLAIRGTSAVKKNLLFKHHNIEIKVIDCITSDIYEGKTVQEISQMVRNELIEELKDYKRN